MIEVTEETMDGFSELILANKMFSPEECMEIIEKENPKMYKEMIVMQLILGPSFTSGVSFAYFMIRQQLSNDELEKMVS